MKAVILMAGKGTRMAKHYEGPKQLLPVNGKPIVEYVLDAMPSEITEFIFVVGGPHEHCIREHFSSGEYGGKKITFVVQDEQLGLAHAFGFAKDLVGDDKWIGAVGDDIFDPEGLKEMVSHDLAILASRISNPESFGVLVVDEDNNLTHAVEKPEEFISDLVFNGAMMMDKEFFEMEIEPSDRGEYETPDVWMKLINERNRKIKIVESKFWYPVNDKAQLEEAEKGLE